MRRFHQILRRLEPLDVFFVSGILLMGSFCIWLAVR
jgi:hypothetical protein